MGRTRPSERETWQQPQEKPRCPTPALRVVTEKANQKETTMHPVVTGDQAGQGLSNRRVSNSLIRVVGSVRVSGLRASSAPHSKSVNINGKWQVTLSCQPVANKEQGQALEVALCPFPPRKAYSGQSGSTEPCGGGVTANSEDLGWNWCLIIAEGALGSWSCCALLRRGVSQGQ